MKARTNSKTLSLTLAATALVGALFAGNASAMADPGHRYPAHLAGKVQNTDEVQKTGMRWIGGDVGWVRVPNEPGATRTVDLEGRVIEGRGRIFSPKQGK